MILADDFIHPSTGAKGKGRQGPAARSRAATIKNIQKSTSVASMSGRDPPLSSIHERGAEDHPDAENDGRWEGDGRGEREIEEMVRDDPLATQVWRMYARTKAQLPHAQRMENLTWRMMALALRRKQKVEPPMRAHRSLPQEPSSTTQAAIAPGQVLSMSSPCPVDGDSRNHVKTEQDDDVAPGEPSAEDERRGRAPGKSTTKTRIVGFGAGEDDDDETM
jgi:hypothetical protein